MIRKRVDSPIQPAEVTDPAVLSSRIAAETRPVRVSHDPALFEWQGASRGRTPALCLIPAGIYLRSAAARLLCPDSVPRPRISVGVAPRALAIKRDSAGWQLHRKGNGEWGGTIPCRNLVEKLVTAGWKLRVAYETVWDAEHEMLVAKLPEAKPVRVSPGRRGETLAYFGEARS